MTYYPAKSAAPNVFMLGIQDVPLGGLPAQEDRTPLFCPLGYIFSEWGDENNIEFGAGLSFIQKFGDKTWDTTEPYFTHYTNFAKNIFNGNALIQALRRLRPDDAKNAYARLSIEIVPQDVEPYVRDENGDYALDVNSDLQETGSTNDGYRLRWIWEEIADPDDPLVGFGIATSKAGTLVGKDGASATVYPIMDLKASYFGNRGNTLGISLSAVTEKTQPSGSTEYTDDTGNFLYRMKFSERKYENVSPYTWKTDFDRDYFDFTFVKNAINPALNTSIGFDNVYNDNYNFTGTGPINGSAVYEDNLKTVLDLLHAKELAYNEDISTTVPSNIHETNTNSINIVSGRDVSGRGYYTIEVAALEDADAVVEQVTLGKNVITYLSGGDDGDMSAENYDLLVRKQLETFNDDYLGLYDMARFPFTTIVDSGFSVETKEAMFTITSYRPDMVVLAATHEDGKAPYDTLTTNAIAGLLTASAKLNIESEVYQTPFTRGFIMGHSFKLNPTFEWKGETTVLYDLVSKITKWLGDPGGRWDSNESPTSVNRKQITIGDVLNYRYEKLPLRELMWGNNLIAIEYSDRNTLTYTGVQSIYDDDSSMLNSLSGVYSCVAATRVAMKAFKRFSGVEGLTQGELKTNAEKYMNEQLVGVAEGFATFEPLVEFDENDNATGWSWHTVITVTHPVTKTVNIVTIKAVATV